MITGHNKRKLKQLEEAKDDNSSLGNNSKEELSPLELAQRGDPNAQYWLGSCYNNGEEGFEKNSTEAVRWYQLAANQGNANAQNNLGNSYYYGRGVGKDLNEAIRLYQLAAFQEQKDALYNLGTCYFLGEGLQKDVKEAVRYYELAASRGHADAQYNLGICYEYGETVHMNLKEAVHLYRSAAVQGHTKAQYNLAVCYEYGNGIGRDRKEAIRLYQLAAEEGNADAQYNLALCYYNGEGVPQDYKEAARLYELAVVEGDPDVQFSLALCYDNGQGVEKDLIEAIRFYKLAAAQGYALAQYNLGVCYENGNDFKEAVRWYRLAAEQADVDAQYHLGRCYHTGTGIEKTFDEARHWYQSALNQGYLEAKTALKELIQEEFCLNLKTDARQSLTQLFGIYKGYYDDLGLLADLFERHIEQECSKIIRKTFFSQLVDKLIDFSITQATILQDCFEKDPLFAKALSHAMETSINQDDKLSRSLADFANNVLTRGSTLALSRGFEETLSHVVLLYGYIQEKDVFERLYQLYFANRILNGMCESEYAEKNMILKFRPAAGYQWCNKLDGMLKDTETSCSLLHNFKKLHKDDESKKFLFSVSVCSSAYWPTTANIPYHIPVELSTTCERFKRFYLGQHNCRKLIWHMDKGRAELYVRFNSQVQRTLVMTTYQMMILLQFNGAKRVTFRDILDKTGIPKSEITHHLLSLVHPKVAVILKRPNTKTLEDAHQFMLNTKYFNTLQKVVIPLMQPVKKEDDEEEDKKVIEMQRRHQMDASIIRIMKIRRQMKHPLLVAEVIAQLKARFIPKPAKIKKRIDALIEQEYLERDKTDKSVYRYVP